jgi:hypothetical protein
MLSMVDINDSLIAELKPCAHCAKPGIEVEQIRRGDFHEWSIECSGCGCRTDWYGLRDAAIFAWNRRADNENKEPSLKESTDDTQTLSDSRERLEADVRGAVHGAYAYEDYIPENMIFDWLDRQAAITERECMERATSERVGWDCAECAEGLGKYADGLCDPLKERIAELTAERELYRDNMIAQTKRVAELTAERDQLQADLDACRMREKAAEDYDFREAAERWEQAFEDKCCEVVRLTAERDELKERVARFDSISNIDGVANLLVQFEDLTAERDRLQKVVQVQAESFQKLERELKEALNESEERWLIARIAGSLKRCMQRMSTS